jgi:stalled ribosome rescue protein Dom34
MPHSHAVVWLDFKEAHVFRFSPDDVHKERIQAHNPYRKVHHKAGAIGAGHAHSDREFFAQIAEALEGVTEWLLVGPGYAKNDFLHHIEANAPALKDRLVAVEPMDHPTDGELIESARSFFKAADKMRPNSPPVPGHSAS